MEDRLTHHLLLLCERYCAHSDVGDATVGKRCAADGRFFPRLREGKTYTIRKYDEVVRWFSDNWPSDADWPDDVARPLSEAVR